MPANSTLPGFDFVETPARPGEGDFSDDAKYTGEVLFVRHPDVFKAVAAAFFIDGLSIRAVAARYKVSVNTVRAIRDMAIDSATTNAGRVAFFIKSKADQLQRTIRTRSLEVIYDRLVDPKKSQEIPIDTLMQLAKLNDESKSTTSPTPGEIIDVDSFDEVINGLNAEKISAQGDGAEKVGAESGKCSTANENLVAAHFN